MLFRDVIDLISVTLTENDMADTIEIKSNRQIFANKKSISQSEFYQAASTGLKPEIKFEVRSSEYLDEPKLLFNGKEYEILRTFDKNGEIIELICTGIVNKGDSNG
ncbi:phage head closure protein [Bacillus sp. ISL-46]|uniref:phage head closure protein n=1 Tax=Bacillus sp. ISL-46 TaxID=2819129 RepID=UPI001BE59E10|nr:phage head closure protein [Bacillus sp. ISL-46]MBT2722312.1 phage head closure protein [Bacillus sp. ISL-46]